MNKQSLYDLYIKGYAWYSQSQHWLHIQAKKFQVQVALRQRITVARYVYSTRHKNLGPSDWIFMTVAFNSYDTIVEQWRALNKYVKEKFEYVIVDNSTDIKTSKALYHFCKANDVTYLRLLHNPYNNFNSGLSHGLALNWGYQQYVRASQAGYLATLDHDIYPTQKTSLLASLRNQPIYGLIQGRDEKWYLWPGYSLFDLTYLRARHANFAPIPGTDTGGGNWYPVYRHLNREKLTFARHRYAQYQDGEHVQTSSVEFLDTWVHLMAVSGWMDGGKPKDIAHILNKIKKKHIL